jgi:zinc transporter 9
MWREIGNDCGQLPLKIWAWLWSGNPSGPFYAELIRASVDFLNHLCLLSASYINLEPSKRYPYGLEKFKNLVCCLPALFFIYIGLENIIEALSSEAVHAEGGVSWNSHAFYVASLSLESFVILNNVRDANSLNSNRPTSKINFRGLLTGKDPLLQAVLLENAITVLSSIVPICF